MLKYLIGFMLIASPALGATPTDGTIYDSATGKMLRYLTGIFRVGASIASPSTTITVDGTGGVVTAQSFVGPLTGNATTATSVSASGVDLSTVTARFSQVAVDTTTLNALKVDKNVPGQVNLSTVTNQFNQVALDTTTLKSDLTAEVSARTSGDFYVGLATYNIRTDLTAETVARIGQDTAIGASTKALNDLLDSETLARIAADFSIGASTKATNADLASVSLSTAVLSVSTVTINNNKVNRLGNDTMGGSLTLPDLVATYGVDAGTVVAGSSRIGSMVGTTLLVHNTLTSTGTARFGVHVEPVGGFDQTSYSIFNASGSLTMARSESISLSSNGYISGQSSATFNAFFGDGSHLTGITAPADSTKVDKNTPEQVNLSTVTSRFVLIEASTSNLYATKLSTGTPIPNNLIDLSTVATALASKQATGSYITALTGAVTASGPGAVAATVVGPVPPSGVDLSTVTTALAGKQASDADLDDLADGSLTGSKVGSGVPAASIASGSLGATVVASSVAAIVAANSCGSASVSCRINFGADGRIQSVSSAAIAGGGDAALASTQTFSGANTFLSSVTIGPTAYTLAVTRSSGVLVGGYSLVASTNPSGASSITFTGLQAYRRYVLYYYGQHNTAIGRTRIRWNGDAGLNYFATAGCVVSAAHVVYGGSSGFDAAYLTDTNGHTANTAVDIKAEFLIGVQADTTKVFLDFVTKDNRGSNGDYQSCRGGPYYDGASPVTSLEMTVTAGTMTGQVYLYEHAVSLP